MRASIEVADIFRAAAAYEAAHPWADKRPNELPAPHAGAGALT